MFRTISVIALITAYAAGGAVITVSTICGNTIGTDSCGNSDGSVTTSLQHLPVYTNSFLFKADVTTVGTGFGNLSFQDSYNFTINSGAGSGTFEVCWAAETDGGSANFTFGPAAGAAGQINGDVGGCPGFGTLNTGLIPFTDGVTQTLVVTLSAIAGSTANTSRPDAIADIRVITPLFFDGTGKPLSNVSFVLASITAPEPATGCLVSLAFAVFGWRKLRR